MAIAPTSDAQSGAAGAPASLFSSIQCTVASAGRYRFAPEWRLTERVVPHYSVFVCLQGGADFLVGGQPYRLEPGGVLLAPPGMPHTAWHNTAHPLGAFFITFTARLYGVLDVPAICSLPVLLMPGAMRRPKFADSARSITHHFIDRPPGYEQVLHTHCVRLISLMWSETLTQAHGTTASASYITRLLPVLREVETRYADTIRLGELASLVHLHLAYFCTLFKQTTGYSPLQYLARFRLEHACALLIATELPLEEIASRTGFYDAAHLTRVFRRVKGTSPGRYRRSEERPIS